MDGNAQLHMKCERDSRPASTAHQETTREAWTQEIELAGLSQCTS